MTADGGWAGGADAAPGGEGEGGVGPTSYRPRTDLDPFPEKTLDFSPCWAGCPAHAGGRERTATRHPSPRAPAPGADGRARGSAAGQKSGPGGGKGGAAGGVVRRPRPGGGSASGHPAHSSAGQPRRGAAGRGGGLQLGGARRASRRRGGRRVVAAAAVAARGAAPHRGTGRVDARRVFSEDGRRRRRAAPLRAPLRGAVGPLSAPAVAAAPALHRE